MKKHLCILSLALLCVTSQLFANDTPTNWTKGFILGDPGIQSINAMTFGPEGILFIGDSKQAGIFAVEMKAELTRSEPEAIQMERIDHTLAALMGMSPEQVLIQDMAVHPISKEVYIAVNGKEDQVMLFKTAGKEFELVDLKMVSYGWCALQNPVAEDAKDRRGRSLRKWAISDIAFFQNQVMVSGLSNEEFSSTFRSIPFPFEEKQEYASLEIYHAAHGRYETYAPIKTFIPYSLDGKAHLVASYTCTPLVIFPIDELEAGKHHKGKTVAELGNRNTPLDIIAYEKDGREYLLMANSSRALMKIDPVHVSEYQDFLTEPVKGNSNTAGIDFINMPYVNVQQLDNYSAQFVLAIQRKADGDLVLETISKKRL